MTALRVAIAVIIRHRKVLVAKRLANISFGGKWEFPGGKIEAAESSYQALLRELKEELDINVSDAQLLFNLEHSYNLPPAGAANMPKKRTPAAETAQNSNILTTATAMQTVSLDVWLVKNFSNRPRALAASELKWLSYQQLLTLDMLTANSSIIPAIGSYFNSA